MFALAERMKLIADSITLAVSAKAGAMKKAGIDVVGFGAGEPDFDTPAFIKEAAEREYLIFFEHDPQVAAGYIRERHQRLSVEPLL